MGFGSSVFGVSGNASSIKSTPVSATTQDTTTAWWSASTGSTGGPVTYLLTLNNGQYVPTRGIFLNDYSSTWSTFYPMFAVVTGTGSGAYRTLYIEGKSGGLYTNGFISITPNTTENTNYPNGPTLIAPRVGGFGGDTNFMLAVGMDVANGICMGSTYSGAGSDYMHFWNKDGLVASTSANLICIFNSIGAYTKYCSVTVSGFGVVALPAYSTGTVSGSTATSFTALSLATTGSSTTSDSGVGCPVLRLTVHIQVAALAANCKLTASVAFNDGNTGNAKTIALGFVDNAGVVTSNAAGITVAGAGGETVDYASLPVMVCNDFDAVTVKIAASVGSATNSFTYRAFLEEIF